MHAVGIWCKTKIQIDPGGLEVNFSLQELVRWEDRIFTDLSFPACRGYNGRKQIRFLYKD